MKLVGIIAFSLGLAAAAPTATPKRAALPIVDLGYVRQQATSETAGYYIFKNIRFAAPPLGDLRLRKPRPPLNQTTVQNGVISGSTACLQVLTGSEDCLFLDVYVPKNASQENKLPVLGWWYGGAYILGSKEGMLPPAYTADRAAPYVFVAANYRLGAMGFLSMPGVDIDQNIGLHDTIMAMRWIEKYIDRFGGDPERITVMGQSAGGGVVEHAITAYGGAGEKAPFQQVLSQSPGWAPERTTETREPAWNAFKAATGCADAACIRRLPTEWLALAHTLTVGQFDLVNPWFMPIVDGDYVPDYPMRLLAQGKYHKEIKSIVASNARREGDLFVPSTLTPANIETQFAKFSTNQTILNQLKAMYPSDGTSTGHLTRYREFVSDIVFNCNSFYMMNAFSKNPPSSSLRYMFNVGTAGHGADASYTFGSGSVLTNPTILQQHQGWLLDYITKGAEAVSENWDWPLWNEEEGLGMWMNATGLAVGKDYFGWDRYANRCRFIVESIGGN